MERDITGQKFGRLTAIKFMERKGRIYYWLFRCDCGNKKIIQKQSVLGGITTSCGCYHKEMMKGKKFSYKHGMYKTYFHRVWRGIKNRCLNKKNKHYKDYGGRGINICDRWLKFENFRDDMYQSYLEHNKEFGDGRNNTIDRINNNSGYYKDNCRWATQKEQCNNRRNSRLITFNNETLTIAQWEEKFSLSSNILYQRIDKLKWSIKKALITPVKKYNYD